MRQFYCCRSLSLCRLLTCLFGYRNKCEPRRLCAAVPAEMGLSGGDRSYVMHNVICINAVGVSWLGMCSLALSTKT
jgi:hypothetical protein